MIGYGRLLASISVPRAREHPLRTLLTVVGTMLGVAVLVGVVLVNRTITRSVGAAIDDISGKADLQVSGGPLGLEERLLETLRAVPGVYKATPVLQEVARVAPSAAGAPGLAGQQLTILGIHMLGDDEHFRSYKSAEIDEIKRDPLVFLNSSTNLILSEDFARKHGLRLMDKLPLLTPSGRQDFTVWGLIRDERMARALGGGVAVMYYQAAQVAFHRGSLVDRFDVAVAEGQSPEQVRAAILAALGPGATVEHPSRRGERINNLLGSFRQALVIGSALALLVGLFLIYNTVSISVVQRQAEIGTLRALGMTRGQVRALFTLEGTALGLLGSGLGVLLGLWLSRLILIQMTRAVSEVYLQVHAEDVQVDRPLLALGILLGTLGATLSALWPAREATRVQPVSALRGVSLGVAEAPPARVRIADLLAAALLLLSWPVSQLAPIAGQPIPGYAALGMVLVAALLITPRALVLTSAALAGPLRGLFGIEGQIACGNLRRDLGRAAVTVGALLCAVSTVTALAVLLASFERSTLRWMDQTMPADLFITSASPFAASTRNAHMSGALYGPLRDLPEVAAVNRVRIVDMNYRHTEIKLVSFDWQVEREYGSFTFLAGDQQGADAALQGGGGVLCSENFARRFGVRPGDTVTLMASGGPRALRIAAVVVDYTSDQGALFLDRAAYSALWQDTRVDTYKLHLRKGADLEQARGRIQAMFGANHTLFILSNRELKQEVRRVLGQTFQLVDALQMVALLIAALGVVNTLLAGVLDRMREIGVLRAIGGLRRQVRRVILIEAALLGLCSGVLGIGTGLLSGEILLRAVNTVQSGWLWQFALPGVALLRLFGLVLLAAAMAGWVPARQAARLPIIRALKYE